MEENTLLEQTENKINFEKVLDLSLQIGVGLISSGGSVSRAETAVDRICTAYGAEEVNVAAFASMITASIRTPDGHDYSFMKRVYSTSNNLALLEKFNQLSRDICANKYPVDEALKMSYDLYKKPSKNKWIAIGGASLVAGAFSVFFGGTIEDFLPALLVAFAMSGLSELLSKRSLNVYATTFLLAVVGGMLSISLCKLFNLMGLNCHGGMVMTGTIMILIPGLLTTNAVRDMFTGDLMSGTFLLLNGLLLTVVIAAGYGVSMIILKPITDFVVLVPYAEPLKTIVLAISGTIGAVAICLFFNINFKRMGWALMATVLTMGVYIGIVAWLPDNIFLNTLIPTLFAAILSEILARFIKIPATVILVPGIIAFVPGKSLYETMEALVQGDLATAASSGRGCLLTLLGLAVGICVATVLFRLISPVKLKFYKKNKMAIIKKFEKENQKDDENGLK